MHARTLIGAWILLFVFAPGGAPFPAQSQAATAALDTSSAPRRVAFGSCCHQDKPQPVWDALADCEPDLLLMLGDNIYGDTQDMDELRAKYAKLAASPGFARLRQRVPVLATWDDHDYGANDTGAAFAKKAESAGVFFEFFPLVKQSVAAEKRAGGGVYSQYLLGPADRRVQILLLDLRTFRTPELSRQKKPTPESGPYKPNDDPAQNMLGDTQWQWLEQQLKQPATFRFIGCSTQFLSDEPGWEAWVLFPKERQRMLKLIALTKANGVVFLSGDTHWAELSRLDKDVPYTLYDLTSSGLTETWHNVAPNKLRVNCSLDAGQPYVREANFGTLTIDWEERLKKPDPLLTMEIRDVTGKVRMRHSLRASELTPR